MVLAISAVDNVVAGGGKGIDLVLSDLTRLELYDSPNPSYWMRK